MGASRPMRRVATSTCRGSITDVGDASPCGCRAGHARSALPQVVTIRAHRLRADYQGASAEDRLPAHDRHEGGDVSSAYRGSEGSGAERLYEPDHPNTPQYTTHPA